jgi:predicted ester cyclase
MSVSGSEIAVRRFYDELWNGWRLELVDEILAEGLRFRGSRGAILAGRSEFRRYAEETRAAFPDWHNRIDDLVVDGDRVAARLTWTGTQTGAFEGRAASGARVEYVGAAFFRVVGDVIDEAWVVGDTEGFRRTLERA